MPKIVIVGRGAAEGQVELWDRRTGDREVVPVAEVVARLAADLIADPPEPHRGRAAASDRGCDSRRGTTPFRVSGIGGPLARGARDPAG